MASARLSPRCSLGRARKMAEDIVRKNSKTRLSVLKTLSARTETQGGGLALAGRRLQAMGGLAGAFRRRDERRQQAAQQQANGASAVASQQMSYTRAMAACLEGRGYGVK